MSSRYRKSHDHIIEHVSPKILARQMQTHIDPVLISYVAIACFGIDPTRYLCLHYREA